MGAHASFGQLLSRRLGLASWLCLIVVPAGCDPVFHVVPSWFRLLCRYVVHHPQEVLYCFGVLETVACCVQGCLLCGCFLVLCSTSVVHLIAASVCYREKRRGPYFDLQGCPHFFPMLPRATQAGGGLHCCFLSWSCGDQVNCQFCRAQDIWDD